MQQFPKKPADQVDSCIVTRYSTSVIQSFRHKGVERFFLKGTKSGIQGAHAAKLARQLQRLDVSRHPQDMKVPGWKLHSLKGDQKDHWAARVSGNWRLTFKFEGEHAILVDYRDYH
jgi:toxin HigB-1